MLIMGTTLSLGGDADVFCRCFQCVLEVLKMGLSPLDSMQYLTVWGGATGDSSDILACESASLQVDFTRHPCVLKVIQAPALFLIGFHR